MAARPGFQKFKKLWLSDSGTYPIIAIISGAVSLVGVFGTRILVSHPDVYVSRHDRGAIVRDNKARAVSHSEHYLKRVAVSRETSDITPGLNKALVNRKIRGINDDDDDDNDE